MKGLEKSGDSANVDSDPIAAQVLLFYYYHFTATNYGQFEAENIRNLIVFGWELGMCCGLKLMILYVVVFGLLPRPEVRG